MKVSIDEAAEYANVSARTIWNWLRKNKLTRYTMRDMTVVDLGEVQVVMDAPSRVTPTPQIMAVMARRIEKLQREVEFLLYSQGSYSAAEYTDDQVALIYSIVDSLLRKQRLIEEEIREVATIMDGLSEEILEAVQIKENLAQPWAPFHKLIVRAQKELKKRKEYKINLDLQLLYRRLMASRNRLRDMALIFIEADTDSKSRMELINALGPNNVLEGEVLRRLIWRTERHPPYKFKALSDNLNELLRESLEMVETGVDDRANQVFVLRRLRKATEILNS